MGPPAPPTASSTGSAYANSVCLEQPHGQWPHCVWSGRPGAAGHAEASASPAVHCSRDSTQNIVAGRPAGAVMLGRGSEVALARCHCFTGDHLNHKFDVVASSIRASPKARNGCWTTGLVTDFLPCPGGLVPGHLRRCAFFRRAPALPPGNPLHAMVVAQLPSPSPHPPHTGGTAGRDCVCLRQQAPSGGMERG